jgi:uncharacterized membrane protein YecN with MAPEG domain
VLSQREKKNISYHLFLFQTKITPPVVCLFFFTCQAKVTTTSFKKLKAMGWSDLELDVHRTMCAAAWIMFALILKNIVLLIVMATQRRKHAMYKVPEDFNTFGIEQQQGITNDWSLAGRIQRILANDVEYVPYFLALLIIIFCTIDLTSQVNHHYLARVLVYGVTFTIGRYLHTISYLLRNTYGRILGFLISVIILFTISVDHVYYMTKGLYNYKP